MTRALEIKTRPLNQAHVRVVRNFCDVDPHGQVMKLVWSDFCIAVYNTYVIRTLQGPNRIQKQQVSFIFWNWLQMKESPNSVRMPSTTSDEMNHPDVKLVLITNPQVQNSMRLWLKHLAAHLWKPMFFNETLVIKWVPWLFHHKTTREDKTMCLIYRVAASSLFLSFHFIPSPILFLIFVSQDEPLLMSLTNLWLTFVSPVHLSAALCPLRLSPSSNLSLSFIINSCDAAQQSLSEWYTSTITNKPKYLHSAGMICINEGRERGRVRRGQKCVYQIFFSTVKKQLFPV